eukprot:7093393-Alexandrium_andersonii.AAC.1
MRDSPHGHWRPPSAEAHRDRLRATPKLAVVWARTVKRNSRSLCQSVLAHRTAPAWGRLSEGPMSIRGRGPPLPAGRACHCGVAGATTQTDLHDLTSMLIPFTTRAE